MSAGFLEIQLDPRLSSGSSGGLTYSTIVVSNPAENETRFPQRSRGYWAMTLSMADRSKDELNNLTNHFAAVQGKSLGWRFRNEREYIAINETLIYFPTGTTAQLSIKRKLSGEIVKIKKPDMATPITLTRDGNNFPSTDNWSLDTTTGIITFNEDQTGHGFTWSGFFDTPMRFDDDNQDAAQSDIDIFSWDEIKIKEVQVYIPPMLPPS